MVSIAAEPGTGLSLEAGLVMGQSSYRGQNLVEILASWSGSRQTEVPVAKWPKDELSGATRYRTNKQVEITSYGRSKVLVQLKS